MQPRQDNHNTISSSGRALRAARAKGGLGMFVAWAVALVFADSSIVVLALPQIVDRLHTTISQVIWVIAAYNLALITAAVAIMPFAGRLPPYRGLMTGLGVFGLASLGAGTSQSMGMLIALRCVQGAAGGLLACASLPMFSSAMRPGRSALAGWAAAAAVGAAIGPAIGGVLTQIFDWRAIFLAQAPVAAIAALAITFAQPRASPRDPTANSDIDRDAGVHDQGSPAPAIANLALAFISAALIGALFLVTTLLINVWQLSPLGAAAVVSTIPLGTVLAERALRHRSPFWRAGGGAVAVAGGLTGLALVSHRQLGWELLALILCGTGLGMAFPALTASALRSSGRPVLRAARTVAARDAGLVLGLLILTPVFVAQLHTAPARATAPITTAVLNAPIPLGLKLELGAGLLAAEARASQSQLPDINPTFTQAADNASGATRSQLAALKAQVQGLIQGAATQSFKRPLFYCALFALLTIPALALDRARAARLHRIAPTRSL